MKKIVIIIHIPIRDQRTQPVCSGGVNGYVIASNKRRESIEIKKARIKSQKDRHKKIGSSSRLNVTKQQETPREIKIIQNIIKMIFIKRRRKISVFLYAKRTSQIKTISKHIGIIYKIASMQDFKIKTFFRVEYDENKQKTP